MKLWWTKTFVFLLDKWLNDNNLWRSSEVLIINSRVTQWHQCVASRPPLLLHLRLQLTTLNPCEMRCPPVWEHETWAHVFFFFVCFFWSWSLLFHCGFQAVLYKQACFQWWRSFSVGTISCNHQSRLLFSYRAYIFLLICIFISYICHLLLCSYTLCVSARIIRVTLISLNDYSRSHLSVLLPAGSVHRQKTSSNLLLLLLLLPELLLLQPLMARQVEPIP